MNRKIIIFGNGIGMALDPVHFSLTNALNDVWDMQSVLVDSQKELIGKSIGRTGSPSGEDELDTLHLAVTACTTLNNISSDRVHLLSGDGKNFPVMVARYIHKVATRLHNFDGALPEKFVEKLVEFIKDTKSHVATLNYDKLIYSSFIENGVFNGYCGDLVDGMIDAGFDPDNLERLYGKNFGYYLHLHGSPLFINSNGLIKKMNRDNLTIQDDRIGKHIVLTHVKHKPEVIAASGVLSAYWGYLRFALSEVDEIILFGYSGIDEHLNELIKPYTKKVKVKIVEWSGSGTKSIRETFWKEKLGNNVSISQHDDILDFKDW
jgi:hypothetical protein